MRVRRAVVYIYVFYTQLREVRACVRTEKSQERMKIATTRRVPHGIGRSDDGGAALPTTNHGGGHAALCQTPPLCKMAIVMRTRRRSRSAAARAASGYTRRVSRPPLAARTRSVCVCVLKIHICTPMCIISPRMGAIESCARRGTRTIE